MQIVVDGYNYIHRVNGSALHKGASMDLLQRDFLEKCARYKKMRSVRISVVFDAYATFSPGRHSENYRGIEVIYWKEGETADDFIIGLIRKRPAGLYVVSSDRAIIDEAKLRGVTFLTPVAFAEMLSSPAYGPDEEEDYPDNTGPKKGNPRKLPKKVRKAVKGINKL